MTTSIFSTCGESCGYTAALVCIFSWGSFGVPLKFAKTTAAASAAAAAVPNTPSTAGTPLTQQQAPPPALAPPPEVNFFVMQSYKTLMCFATCWFVVLMGEPICFSYWGIASGLFWVPGASCGIYGIRNAGLATAVGTWSSIQVLTSFLFGIVVFQEQVKSLEQACMAFLMLILGLIGMARYAGAGAAHAAKLAAMTSSSPKPMQSTEATISASQQQSARDVPAAPSSGGIVRKSIRSVMQETNAPLLRPMEIAACGEPETSCAVANGSSGRSSPISVHDDEDRVLHGSLSQPQLHSDDDDDEYYFNNKSVESKMVSRKSSSKVLYTDYVVLCGGRFALHKRQVGILGSVINGAWGGCSLIPLHYARRDDHLSGAAYVVSYAIGAMIVNTAMWILLFMYHYFVTHRIRSNNAKQPQPLIAPRSAPGASNNSSSRWNDALNSLPKWHFRQLWRYGFMAGLLHSIGNFSSMLAVTYLGQATGYSICQLQLMVSGLWAVFYFREIRRPATIAKWFISAFVAICGIIWLSIEHQGSVSVH